MPTPRASFAAGILLLLFSLSSPAAEPRQIDVGLTTHLGDQQSFVEGDKVSFLLSLDHDAYVYLFYRDAAANLLQLLPNERMPGHFFETGLFMPVPSAQQRFQFTVQPPFGDEQIIVIATDNGDLSFPGDVLANGLILLDGDIDRFSAEIKRGSAELFGRAELLLQTQPAKASN